MAQTLPGTVIHQGDEEPRSEAHLNVCNKLGDDLAQRYISETTLDEKLQAGRNLCNTNAELMHGRGELTAGQRYPQTACLKAVATSYMPEPSKARRRLKQPQSHTLTIRPHSSGYALKMGSDT